MNTTKTFGALPTPLRVAVLTFLGVFLITFISLISSPSQSAVIPYAFGILGAATFVLGMTLATNYRGSASAFAERWPVAGGRSLMRVFIRVFGTCFMVGGALFVVASVVAIVARTS